jgi:hypothetical protein
MKRKDDFLMHDIDGKGVLVPLGSQVVNMNGLITMNTTGGFIWCLLDRDRSEEELVEAVVDRFDVDRKTALADIRAFLDEISRMGLLQT